MTVRQRYLRLTLAVALALAVGGCTGGSQRLSPPDVAVPAGVVVNPPFDPRANRQDGDCNPRRSLPSNPDVSEWKKRHKNYLVVGVSQADVTMSHWNPNTRVFEGFNIDLVTEIARAIWPDDDVEKHLRFKVVAYGDRPFTNLTSGSGQYIDLIATSLTATCARASLVYFSQDYLDSGQTVLVRKNEKDDSPEFAGLEHLGGRRVCAAQGTTSLEHLSQFRTQQGTAPVPVAAPDFIDCLVMLRQHQVDGVSTGHHILLGFAQGATDTTLVTEPPHNNSANCGHHKTSSRCTWLSDEPHSFAAARNDDGVELITFVNHVLTEMRDDGRWQTIHDKWLKDLPDAGPPPAQDSCPRKEYPCQR